MLPFFLDRLICLSALVPPILEKALRQRQIQHVRIVETVTVFVHFHPLVVHYLLQGGSLVGVRLDHLADQILRRQRRDDNVVGRRFAALFLALEVASRTAKGREARQEHAETGAETPNVDGGAVAQLRVEFGSAKGVPVPATGVCDGGVGVPCEGLGVFLQEDGVLEASEQNAALELIKINK